MVLEVGARRAVLVRREAAEVGRRPRDDVGAEGVGLEVGDERWRRSGGRRCADGGCRRQMSLPLCFEAVLQERDKLLERLRERVLRRAAGQRGDNYELPSIVCRQEERRQLPNRDLRLGERQPTSTRLPGWPALLAVLRLTITIYHFDALCTSRSNSKSSSASASASSGPPGVDGSSSASSLASAASSSSASC